jgi:hypothetical protein
MGEFDHNATVRVLLFRLPTLHSALSNEAKGQWTKAEKRGPSKAIIWKQSFFILSITTWHVVIRNPEEANQRTVVAALVSVLGFLTLQFIEFIEATMA